MDIGTYSIAALRDVFHDEPIECISAEARLLPPSWDQRIDEGFNAEFRFPNGGLGKIEADIRKRSWWGLPGFSFPRIVVQHRAEEVTNEKSAGKNRTHMRSRKVTFWGFPGAHYWHSISVVEEHVIQNVETREVLNRWTTTENVTAYAWHNAQIPGDAYWSTYRHMLDQFVNKVRGKEGSGVWIASEDSTRQSKAIDMAFRKAGLPLRPTSSYRM